MKRALIMLGGFHHDFAGFAANMVPLIESAGYTAETTYDMSQLLRLTDGQYDMIISYTSFSRHREGMNDSFPQCLTDDEAVSLSRWVQSGGKLLGVHSATVHGACRNPQQKALYGAAFLEHPRQYSFMIYPLVPEHPITAGIEAFAVKDEFYIQEYEPSLEVHMVAIDRGIAYPMVWTRKEGSGTVAVIAMGHSDLVWNLPLYRQLMQQTIAWLEVCA